jgi:hypothetical protein
MGTLKLNKKVGVVVVGCLICSFWVLAPNSERGGGSAGGADTESDGPGPVALEPVLLRTDRVAAIPPPPPPPPPPLPPPHSPHISSSNNNVAVGVTYLLSRGPLCEAASSPVTTELQCAAAGKVLHLHGPALLHIDAPLLPFGCFYKAGNMASYYQNFYNHSAAYYDRTEQRMFWNADGIIPTTLPPGAAAAAAGNSRVSRAAHCSWHGEGACVPSIPPLEGASSSIARLLTPPPRWVMMPLTRPHRPMAGSIRTRRSGWLCAEWKGCVRLTCSTAHARCSRVLGARYNLALHSRMVLDQTACCLCVGSPLSSACDPINSQLSTAVLACTSLRVSF